jgi:hypothetical protein
MFFSNLLLLFTTFGYVLTSGLDDPTAHNNSPLDDNNPFDNNNNHPFDDNNFNDFYNCLKNCATSNSINIDNLDDLVSDDKICNTLTTNNNFIQFMKCYINTCKFDFNTTFPSNTNPTSKIDDKNFNCPGFDPSVLSHNNNNVKSNSYKTKHFHYLSIFIIYLFSL